MSTLLGVLVLGVLPIMFGDRIWNEIIEKPKDLLSEIVGRYLIGTIGMWAVFQLIAVPMILAKGSFSVVVWLWEASVVVILLMQSLWMIKKKKHIFQRGRGIEKDCNRKLYEDKRIAFCYALMCGIVFYQCMMCVLGTQYDEDDARFVVNALEAFDHDSMLLINPATGNYVGTWFDELAKDVVSPWMFYIALIAKIINIHPTIIAHTVLPGVLVAMSYGCYWLIAGRIYQKNWTQRCFFVILIAIINLYFTNSNLTQAVFLLTRVWQGKAVVAGVMIPFLMYLMLLLYDRHCERQVYYLFFLTDMACCLLSGMGIFLSGIFIGITGLYITITRKDFRVLLRLIIACIPTILFGVVYIIL